MSPERRVLEVEAGERGARLDVFLARRLGLSRAEVRRLLARGSIALGGRRVGESARGRALEVGARVEVEAFARPEERRVEPEPSLALRVLARGEGWLAVDKPAGMPVHPLEERERGTLLGALAARHPELHGVGEGGLRSGVVHRLDVDTSGVLLVATAQPAWERLREAFRAHRVEKVYRALAAGRLAREGALELPLVLSRHQPARVRVARRGETGARVVRLAWRPLALFADATLVEVRPVTGFLHQIRAVLAELGHPLLGDRVYADAATAARAPRHLLHASALAFEEIAAESPDPPDFAAALSACAAA